MKIVSTSLLLATAALGGCIQSGPSAPAGAPVLSMTETRISEAELRKDEMLRDLATCESGGHGETDHPIYGGRGAYVGRFQFMPRTVQNYVQEMDGRQLTYKEAVDLAHDYDQAAKVAKYMIFERGRISEWPLCNRKLQLAKQVAEIQKM
jgi:hypothetical protein